MTSFDWFLSGILLAGVIGMIYAFFLMKGGYQWEILPKRIKSRLIGRMLFYVFLFFSVMWVGVLKTYEVEKVRREYQARNAEIVRIANDKRFFYLPCKRLRDIRTVLEVNDE